MGHVRIAFVLTGVCACAALGLWANGMLRSPEVKPPVTAAARPAAEPAPAAALKGPADWTDSFGDGTPDFLRLTDPADRRAFRRWFTFLANAMFLRDTRDLPPDVKDCAGLVRFCYREALRKHDGAWTVSINLTDLPSYPNVRKYSYPFTPLGSDLFLTGETRAGRRRFAQFADAQTLMLQNAHKVTGGLEAAMPADLLFFHQPQQDQRFHVMIFLGDEVVYHTGESPGEIRRPRVEDLMRHPEPRWRPVPGNPYFLGVYRWNILRD